MIRLISSFLYIGFVPIAAGSFAALLALPIAYLVFFMLGLTSFVAMIFGGFFIGWYTSAQIIAQGTQPDPGEIVIDEVIGQWITLLPIFILWAYRPALFADGAQIGRIIVLLVIPFASFRLFDITKPWIIGWADQHHSPLSVMLDDALAGLLAWGPVLLGLTAYLIYTAPR